VVNICIQHVMCFYLLQKEVSDFPKCLNFPTCSSGIATLRCKGSEQTNANLTEETDRALRGACCF
jgi:hypothetical protein